MPRAEGERDPPCALCAPFICQARHPWACPPPNHLIIIIMKGHSLRRACLQPATSTQNSKPRPPTTQFYNLSRFRFGAWKLTLKQINRSGRFCSFCINRSKRIMEDEEHTIFHCPEYNPCRLNYPEIFLSMENNTKDHLFLIFFGIS